MRHTKHKRSVQYSTVKYTGTVPGFAATTCERTCELYRMNDELGLLGAFSSFLAFFFFPPEESAVAVAVAVAAGVYADMAVLWRFLSSRAKAS